MARKKKVKENVKIHGIADKGKAVGRDEEGIVYFVDGPVPGDVVDVLITRKKSSFRKGIVKAYRSYSDERTEPFCSHFELCGGCKWQHLAYASQLHYKEQTVRDAFRKFAGIHKDIIHPIIGCDETRRYRNKLEYSFSARRWVPQSELDTDKPVSFGPAAGFHRAGAFDKIVQIEECHLQEDLSNQVRNFIDTTAREKGWTYYNSREHHGFLRNLVVRNTTLDQWMIVMVFGENDQEAIEFLLSSLRDTFPLTSIYFTVNEKVNDVIYDLDVTLYHGAPYIVEELGDLQYRIGPKSFFQTNSRQAKVLYDIVVKMAGIQPHETVYDLYTGLGSIALYIAQSCHKVIGIEEIPEAIEDARINMDLNGIQNAFFETGDVKLLFNETFIDRYGHADLIIVDPPRAGLHKDVTTMLNNSGVGRIVYVSCNPATQARDIDLLGTHYIVEEMQPVDMFPHTHHIENVALLKRIEHETS